MVTSHADGAEQCAAESVDTLARVGIENEFFLFIFRKILRWSSSRVNVGLGTGCLACGVAVQRLAVRLVCATHDICAFLCLNGILSPRHGPSQG
jgi:hypothetical protein